MKKFIAAFILGLVLVISTGCASKSTPNCCCVKCECKDCKCCCDKCDCPNCPGK